MRIFPTHDATEILAGTLAGTWINYDVYASPVTGYPAIVPLSSGVHAPVQLPAYSLLDNMAVTVNGGNAWTQHNAYLTTDQAADYLEITPDADTLYVDVVTTGRLFPDMIDPRGLAWPAASDGQAGQDATTGPLAPQQVRDGTVITIWVDSVQVAQVDTATSLKSTRISLDGLTTHTVHIKNMGSVSTPTSDVHRLTLVGLVTTAGGAGTGALWTSPVFDAGDPQTTWIGADWEQAAPGSVNGLTFAVGQTPTPDGSWQSFAVPIVETVPGPSGPLSFTQEGVPHGRAAFLAPAGTVVRGRYATISAMMPSALPTPSLGGSTVPWIRALDVYASVPETETLTLLRLPPLLRGPLVMAVQSARGAVLAKLHADAVELTQSYSIGGARGRWLQRYGADQDLPQAPGEGQAAYAARLQAALAGKATGPAAQFVATQLSAYIGGTVTISAYGTSGSTWTYTLSVPAAWSNPVSPAQIAAFLAVINPAGSIPVLNFL